MPPNLLCPGQSPTSPATRAGTAHQQTKRTFRVFSLVLGITMSIDLNKEWHGIKYINSIAFVFEGMRITSELDQTIASNLKISSKFYLCCFSYLRQWCTSFTLMFPYCVFLLVNIYKYITKFFKKVRLSYWTFILFTYVTELIGSIF